MSVLEVLQATDARTRNGLLYDADGSGAIDDLEAFLRELANDVYVSINEEGHI
jgi:hypothetical protein